MPCTRYAGFTFSSLFWQNDTINTDEEGEEIGEAEGGHYWMQIFDEIRARGVEDILIVSMDGVFGLEEGVKSIFKDVVVHRPFDPQFH